MSCGLRSPLVSDSICFAPFFLNYLYQRLWHIFMVPKDHSDLYRFDFVMKATSSPVNTNQTIMLHINAVFINSGLNPDVKKIALATKNTHPIFLLRSSMRILFFSSFGISRHALIHFGPTPMKKAIPTTRKISPKAMQCKFIVSRSFIV